MTNTEWKAVEGWPYEVSNDGRVRNLKGRVLKEQPSRQGYSYVVLSRVSDSRRRWTVKVHKLVALAFIGPRPTKHDINHKNLIKTDNRASNLEYLTKYDHLAHTSAALNLKRLTEAQTLYARDEFASGRKTLNQLCLEMNVCAQSLRHLIKGDTKAHLPRALSDDEFRQIASRNKRLKGARRKVDERQVHQIRERASQGIRVNVLALEYGLTKRSVYSIIKRRAWASV